MRSLQLVAAALFILVTPAVPQAHFPMAISFFSGRSDKVKLSVDATASDGTHYMFETDMTWPLGGDFPVFNATRITATYNYCSKTLCDKDGKDPGTEYTIPNCDGQPGNWRGFGKHKKHYQFGFDYKGGEHLVCDAANGLEAVDHYITGTWAKWACTILRNDTEQSFWIWGGRTGGESIYCDEDNSHPEITVPENQKSCYDTNAIPCWGC